jgi:hypothetical protein
LDSAAAEEMAVGKSVVDILSILGVSGGEARREGLRSSGVLGGAGESGSKVTVALLRLLVLGASSKEKIFLVVGSVPSTLLSMGVVILLLSPLTLIFREGEGKTVLVDKERKTRSETGWPLEKKMVCVSMVAKEPPSLVT